MSAKQWLQSKVLKCMPQSLTFTSPNAPRPMTSRTWKSSMLSLKLLIRSTTDLAEKVHRYSDYMSQWHGHQSAIIDKQMWMHTCTAHTFTQQKCNDSPPNSSRSNTTNSTGPCTLYTQLIACYWFVPHNLLLYMYSTTQRHTKLHASIIHECEWDKMSNE